MSHSWMVMNFSKLAFKQRLRNSISYCKFTLQFTRQVCRTKTLLKSEIVIDVVQIWELSMNLYDKWNTCSDLRFVVEINLDFR